MPTVENLDFFLEEKRLWSRRKGAGLISQFWLAGIYENLHQTENEIRCYIRFLSQVEQSSCRLTSAEIKRVKLLENYAYDRLYLYSEVIAENPKKRSGILNFIKKQEARRPKSARHLNAIRQALGLPQIENNEYNPIPIKGKSRSTF